jgi:hypothetical protein
MRARRGTDSESWRIPAEKRKAMATSWDKYQEAKQELERAIAWNNLPNGPKYQHDSFGVSAGHSTPPMLMRCGQQSCGGTNYWESPKALNHELLLVLCEDQRLIERAIERLRMRMNAALAACEAETKERMALIEATKQANP